LFDVKKLAANKKNFVDTMMSQNPREKQRKKHIPCAKANEPYPSLF
jgi:hypothetical protein